jgi:predicted acetyltransferase
MEFYLFLIDESRVRLQSNNGQSRETGNIGYGTQDEEKQNKNTTQYVLDTAIRKQTQITLKQKGLRALLQTIECRDMY